MRHIVSATALRSGEQLAMCGYVFPSYAAAVDAGHKVGNFLPLLTSFADAHARGVDCESCIIRHCKVAS